MSWRPFDYVVALLTVAVVFLLVVPLTASITTGRDIDPYGAEVIDKISTGALSIIGLYVGAMIQRKRDEEELARREREREREER